MSDQIGRIAVPTVINSGQTFPLTTQYPFGFSVERPVIVHRFGSLDAKQEQRYYVGIGPRKFQFKHQNLNWAETNQLKAFWEAMQGPWKAFTYNVPNPGGTTTGVLVTFEQTPISFEYLRNAVQVGLNLIEVVDPTQAPTYAVNSTCLRFPSTALSTALLSEVQQIIPLVHIRVRESAVADIYVSDRRVTVGGQLYLPRLIGIGEPGSDVLISQDIKGTSDNVRFTFGNGDRVMTQLANDTDLKYAEIDLCLFHVNSGILLQLWKGVIQNFTSDGTPIFPVTCSDGFFQIMNQYLKGSPPSSNPSFTPVGRIISIIGRPESATPYFSGTITSWDSSTGTIGVTPDPNGIVQAGDCLVVRYKADASNSANPTSITDSGCQNIAYPDGMTPGAEAGNLVRVIQGVSRGTPPRKIVANTATTITWDLPMLINPGDVWIIEEPTWPYSCDTTSLDNSNPLAVTTINMPTDNFVDEALVIAGFTVDVNGNESPDGDAPIREDWVFGAEGLSKVAGLVFQMQGTLGIESNAAQPLYLNRPVTVGDVKAYVQTAPTGSAITFTIYVGGAAWLTLTIPAGQTAGERSI